MDSAVSKDTLTLVIDLDLKNFDFGPGNSHIRWVQSAGINAETTQKALRYMQFQNGFATDSNRSVERTGSWKRTKIRRIVLPLRPLSA